MKDNEIPSWFQPMPRGLDAESVQVHGNARVRCWRATAEAAARGQWVKALDLAGNQSRQQLLYEWWTAGAINADELADPEVILSAWDHGPRAHLLPLGERRWVELFTATGYVTNWLPRPTRPITVWRGAPSITKGRGMSWTTERDQADWFRDRWVARGVAADTWVVTVPPSAVLAADNERQEREVILNPRRLPRRIDAAI
jgi:hypothetical protein